MLKVVMVSELLSTASVEVTDIVLLPEDERGPDGLEYRVEFDTSFDGQAGVGRLDISQERAVKLGLIEEPQVDITQIGEES